MGQKQRRNNVFSETKLGRWALDVNLYDIRVARLCEVDVSEDSAGRKLCRFVRQVSNTDVQPFRVV